MESTEGEGSTFYISLPYEPYEEDWVGMMKLSGMDYKNWLDFDGHFKYIFFSQYLAEFCQNTRNEVREAKSQQLSMKNHWR